ncbi:protein FAM169B [Thalassophryne amazonica]|uniref:protein FAM169B n=1 Tax=Thalassophryne amazonica TaxID=390379 RepID=UPI001471D5BF|nr:protein FAM169B [Thalassophryne amazonica]
MRERQSCGQCLQVKITSSVAAEHRSIMERVIMFLLSQVVDIPSQDEALFSLHPHIESGKLLWRDGEDSEAVGFCTVKHKASLCGRFLNRQYLLPVLDTVLVRRRCWRRGLGLHMLEDFCRSFSKEDVRGVSAPLSPGMVVDQRWSPLSLCTLAIVQEVVIAPIVLVFSSSSPAFDPTAVPATRGLRSQMEMCRHFLQEHKNHREHLHEVEAPGSWTQQRNIWLSIQLGYSCHSINEERSPSAGEMVRNEEDSSKKKLINNWEQDVASVNTCEKDTLAPLQVDVSE